MRREMQKMVTENKRKAAELIRYARPNNGRNMKSRPTVERVTEILSAFIPYNIEKPVIANISVMEYNRNDIIKSAHFRVETANGKVFKISAYQHLKGRTQEEKEADKTATFPSGLFNIFHSEIV